MAFCYSSRSAASQGCVEVFLYIQMPQSVRATPREAFYVDGCIGGVFFLSRVTSKKVDLVKYFKMDCSLCVRK